MDVIAIRELEVHFHVGVPDAERDRAQRLLLDIEMERDVSLAAAADDLSKTVDYYAVSRRLLRLGEGGSWRLIETLAVEIAVGSSAQIALLVAPVVVLYSFHDSRIIAWPLHLGTLHWYDVLRHDRGMIAAVLASEKAAGWLNEDGFGHISTFGGAELGCIAALKALEICSREETRSMVHYIADFVGRRLREIQSLYPEWFIGIRQHGVILGLEFSHPQGAKYVMKHLYENGVWAIFSTLDPRVLQYKPGVLLKPEVAEEMLDRTDLLAQSLIRQRHSTGSAP